ncbi:MAG: hypothetical protein MZU97_16600 [Bacillus subtilis]|nr:hypothetical protein [Bacillus subtilis]
MKWSSLIGVSFIVYQLGSMALGDLLTTFFFVLVVLVVFTTIRQRDKEQRQYRVARARSCATDVDCHLPQTQDHDSKQGGSTDEKTPNRLFRIVGGLSRSHPYAWRRLGSERRHRDADRRDRRRPSTTPINALIQNGYVDKEPYGNITLTEEWIGILPSVFCASI